MDEEEAEFQNHYGWIETDFRPRQLHRSRLFQNHYGWIETDEGGVVVAEVKGFQNHYGWIETRTEARRASIGSCFKTTTVGLRHGMSVPRPLWRWMFQNHYGWIETGVSR